MGEYKYKINYLGIKELACSLVTLDSYTDLVSSFPGIEDTIEQEEIDKALDAIENHEVCYFKLFTANIGVTKEIAFFITVTPTVGTTEVTSIQGMISEYLKAIKIHLTINKMEESGVIAEALSRIRVLP